MLIDVQNLNDLEDVNNEKIIEKAKKNIATWNVRNLTLLGKIEIVNSLIGSLFIYKMQNLPIISKSIEAGVKEMITQFIWNGRKPKIRTHTLMLNKQDGGRKLVNLRLRDKSLKVEWIKRIHTDSTLAYMAYYFINKRFKNILFWGCIFSVKDCIAFFSCNKFWNDVLKTWAECNFYQPK